MKLKEESEKAGLKLNIQKTKIIASGPIASWQIDGETMETVTHFIFLGCKITVDGDCSHGTKRHLLLGRKATTNLDNILESIIADFSIETLQVRQEWLDIPKVMKEKNLQPRLSFTDKQKLREFSTTKTALHQMLKDLIETRNPEKVYKLEPKTTK